MKGLLQFKHKEQGQINIRLLLQLHNLVPPFILHHGMRKVNVCMAADMIARKMFIRNAISTESYIQNQNILKQKRLK